MATISNPEHIELFRLKTLRSALRLEIVGLKRRGRSVYSIIKQELGLKGSREKVYEQLGEHIAAKDKELGI